MENELIINVLIADDHELFVEGISSLLRDFRYIKITGIAKNGLEVMALLENIDVDVILMDIAMPQLNGIETTKLISKKYPAIKVIVLSMFSETFYLDKMLEAGAKGYLLKNTKTGILADAIKRVYHGELVIADEITNQKTNQSNNNLKITVEFDKKKIEVVITSREIEVIKNIIQGLSLKEIAARLDLSYYTIETHKKKIFKKLGLNSTSALIRFVTENKII